MEYYLGQLALFGFNFTPTGFFPCDGRLLPISQYTALFSLLGAPAGRIAGGTDEIMRNIIAERVLGMPGDIRVDKDLPFNQIPTGGKAA